MHAYISAYSIYTHAFTHIHPPPLQVDREEDVFEAVVLWLQAQPGEGLADEVRLLYHAILSILYHTRRYSPHSTLLYLTRLYHTSPRHTAQHRTTPLRTTSHHITKTRGTNHKTPTARP